MSRKLSKPSLKNYLSTGKVVIEEPHEAGDVSNEPAGRGSTGAEVVNAVNTVNIDKLLEAFSPEDLNTWEPIFKSGAEIKAEKTDLAVLREFFRTMDRTRFTLYMLENEKAAMRMIRSGVQIREPFLLFLLWDDTGAASLYVSEESLIL